MSQTRVFAQCHELTPLDNLSGKEDLVGSDEGEGFPC